jgi:hypothetical protein
MDSKQVNVMGLFCLDTFGDQKTSDVLDHRTSAANADFRRFPNTFARHNTLLNFSVGSRSSIF